MMMMKKMKMKKEKKVKMFKYSKKFRKCYLILNKVIFMVFLILIKMCFNLNI